MHGPHHVAQKSTMMILPLYFSRLTCPPPLAALNCSTGLSPTLTAALADRAQPIVNTAAAKPPRLLRSMIAPMEDDMSGTDAIRITTANLAVQQECYVVACSTRSVSRFR